MKKYLTLFLILAAVIGLAGWIGVMSHPAATEIPVSEKHTTKPATRAQIEGRPEATPIERLNKR